MITIISLADYIQIEMRQFGSEAEALAEAQRLEKALGVPGWVTTRDELEGRNEITGQVYVVGLHTRLVEGQSTVHVWGNESWVSQKRWWVVEATYGYEIWFTPPGRDSDVYGVEHKIISVSRLLIPRPDEHCEVARQARLEAVAE